MVFVLVYLLKNDPLLLERRMQMREKEARQKQIINVSYFIFLFVYLLPGFDKRFGWSDASVAAVIITDILVLLGYGLVFLVFHENSYVDSLRIPT